MNELKDVLGWDGLIHDTRKYQHMALSILRAVMCMKASSADNAAALVVNWKTGRRKRRPFTEEDSLMFPRKAQRSSRKTTWTKYINYKLIICFCSNICQSI